MLPEIRRAIKKTDMKDWKEVLVEFGRNSLQDPGASRLR